MARAKFQTLTEQMFYILLCLLAVIYNLSLPGQISNTLIRLGMNGVLVLAMLPGIQCGISLNLGLPIGIIGGLLGGLLCIEFGFSGWFGFALRLWLVWRFPRLRAVCTACF